MADAPQNAFYDMKTIYEFISIIDNYKESYPKIPYSEARSSLGELLMRCINNKDYNTYRYLVKEGGPVTYNDGDALSLALKKFGFKVINIISIERLDYYLKDKTRLGKIAINPYIYEYIRTNIKLTLQQLKYIMNTIIETNTFRIITYHDDADHKYNYASLFEEIYNYDHEYFIKKFEYAINREIPKEYDKRNSSKETFMTMLNILMNNKDRKFDEYLDAIIGDSEIKSTDIISGLVSMIETDKSREQFLVKVASLASAHDNQDIIRYINTLIYLTRSVQGDNKFASELEEALLGG